MGHLMANDYVTVTHERRIGITVNTGNGEVRPIWRRILIEWPDGEVNAKAWAEWSPDKKNQFLAVDDV